MATYHVELSGVIEFTIDENNVMTYIGESTLTTTPMQEVLDRITLSRAIVTYMRTYNRNRLEVSKM